MALEFNIGGTPVVIVSKGDFMWLNSMYCCLCRRLMIDCVKSI